MSCTLAAPPGTPLTISLDLLLRQLHQRQHLRRDRLAAPLESGSAGPRLCGHPGPPIVVASSASVGVANSARTSTCKPLPPHSLDQRHRQQRVSAQLEEVIVPPHSLYLQHLRPDLRQLLSISPCGASYAAPHRHLLPAPAAPSDPASRSASAAATPTAHTPPAPCTPAASPLHALSTPGLPTLFCSLRCVVSHQPFVARHIFTCHHHCFPYPFMLHQPRFDLSQLNPEPSDLDLKIVPPQKLDVAVRQPPPKVPRPVHPSRSDHL